MSASTRNSPSSVLSAKSHLQTLAAVAALGFVVGSVVLGANLLIARRLAGHVSGRPYASVFHRLDDPVDILFALGDGQANLALTRDPTLSHPNVFLGGKNEAAYRVERPLQGYLGWLFSLGQVRWAEEGLIIVTLIGCSVAACGCGELLRRRGLSPWLGLLVIEVPGALAAIRQVGPELLGMGLVCFGIIAAEDGEVWLAVGMFTLGGLARETYLVVPLVYVIKNRRFLFPHLVWIGWIAIVWLRFDALGPIAKIGGSRLFTWPLWGLIQSLPHLRFAAVTVPLIISVPMLSTLSIKFARRDPLTRIVMLYAITAIFMGQTVWTWWASFTRPLLPLFGFALVALAAHAATSRRAGFNQPLRT
jgi:hypothetical protein